MSCSYLILLVLSCSVSYCFGLFSGRAICTVRLRSLLLKLRNSETEHELEEAEHAILSYVHDEMPRGGP